ADLDPAARHARRHVHRRIERQLHDQLHVASAAQRELERELPDGAIDRLDNLSAVTQAGSGGRRAAISASAAAGSTCAQSVLAAVSSRRMPRWISPRANAVAYAKRENVTIQ